MKSSMIFRLVITIAVVGQRSGHHRVRLHAVLYALGESLVPLKGGEEILGVPGFKGGKHVVLACLKDADVVGFDLVKVHVCHLGSIYPRSYAHCGW